MEEALTEEKDLQDAIIKLEHERVADRTEELRSVHVHICRYTTCIHTCV